MFMEGQESMQLQGSPDQMTIDLKSDLDKILQFVSCEEASFQVSARLGQVDDAKRGRRRLTGLQSPWENPSCNKQPSPFQPPVLHSPLLPFQRELQGHFMSDLAASPWMDDLARPCVPFEDGNVISSDADSIDIQCQQAAKAVDDITQFRNGIDEPEYHGSLLCLMSFPQQSDCSVDLTSHSASDTSKLQQGTQAFWTLSDQSMPIERAIGAGSVVPINTPNSSLSSSVSDEAVDEETSYSRRAADHNYIQVAAGSKRKSALGLISDETLEPAMQADSKKDGKPPKKGKKRVREPRYAIQTRSDRDVLEDGYKWRKYGQKTVKNSPYPRSYYRCTFTKCSVKKTVERSGDDSSLVITTYEGVHIHPSPKASSIAIPGFAIDSTSTPAIVDTVPPFSSLRSPAAVISSLFTDTSCSLRSLIQDHPRVSCHDISIMQNIRGARQLPQFDRGLLEDMVPSMIRNK